MKKNKLIESTYRMQLGIGTQNNKPSIYIGTNLYNDIKEILGNTLGEEVLTYGISPENFMRYKNGKVSSMIRNETGFKSHEGFDAVKTTTIIDSLFSYVSSYYTECIIRDFNSITFSLFNSLESLRIEFSNQLKNYKETEYIDQLLSFRDFFLEISDELGIISNADDRRIAYLTNLIKIRTDIYKIYKYFIRKMRNWPSQLLNRDRVGNLYYINYNELNTDYSMCRHTIGSYMITLIYEYILSGNIDENSKQSVINKIRTFLNDFDSCNEEIKQCLNQRKENNNYCYWGAYYYNTNNDNNNIIWLFDKINKNPSYEISIIENVFNSSKEILSEINLLEEKQIDI